VACCALLQFNGRSGKFSSGAGVVDVEARKTRMPAASAETLCSVMLLLGEHEVKHPATANVRPRQREKGVSFDFRAKV
jgi:hypothetical protein